MPHHLVIRKNACVSNPPKVIPETQSMSTQRVVAFASDQTPPKMVAHTTPTAEPPKKFWEWVKRMDSNGDGLISRKELEEGLRKLGFRCCALKAWFAVAKADANGDGYISGDRELKEFFHYIQQKWGITFL